MYEGKVKSSRPSPQPSIQPPVSMEPWTATKKALHWCGGDISPCPDLYTTAACTEFHVGCRLGSHAASGSHGAMDCDQEDYHSVVVTLAPFRTATYGRLSTVLHIAHVLIICL